jgi:hypothetical protein
VGTFVTKVKFLRGREVEISAHDCFGTRLNVEIEKKYDGETISNFNEMYTVRESNGYSKHIDATNLVEFYVETVTTHIENCTFLTLSEKIVVWEAFKVQHANAIVTYSQRQLAEWQFEVNLDVLGILRAEEISASEDDDDDETDDGDSSDVSDDDDDDDDDLEEDDGSYDSLIHPEEIEDDEEEDDSEIEVDTD